MDTCELTKLAEIALEHARNAITQILTLSTAVLAFSATLSKDFGGPMSTQTVRLLFASWLAQLAAIVCGALALQCLAGNASKGVSNIYATNVRFFATAQNLFFLIGLLLLVIKTMQITQGRK